VKVNGKQVKFARFGGLSPVKQKGYNPNMPTFHSPPCRRGIYAFLHPYYEPFLLSGNEFSGLGTKHAKFERVKDKDGNVIVYTEEEVEGYEGTTNWMKYWGFQYSDEDEDLHEIIKPKKPKIFKYDGELWHHLGEHLKPNEILLTKGSWVLTDFKTYCKALKKEFISKKAQIEQIGFESNNPFSVVCIDHLEVFIEKV
jgi:hypothetical protein